jgi:hypothetical protein
VPGVVVDGPAFVFLVDRLPAVAIAPDYPAAVIELDRLSVRVRIAVVPAVLFQCTKGIGFGVVVGVALLVRRWPKLPAAVLELMDGHPGSFPVGVSLAAARTYAHSDRHFTVQNVKGSTGLPNNAARGDTAASSPGCCPT